MDQIEHPIQSALRAEIRAQGLTQVRVAQLAGWAQPNVSGWLAGRRSMPLAVAERLAVALGVRVQPPTQRERARLMRERRRGVSLGG